MTIKTKLAALFASIAAALGLLLVAPVASVNGSQPVAAASAGDCTVYPYVCGRIVHSGGASDPAIGIIHNWGDRWTILLRPGRSSAEYWRDTDGFFIGAGFCATVTTQTGEGDSRYSVRGPGNFKVSDWYASHYVNPYPC